MWARRLTDGEILPGGTNTGDRRMHRHIIVQQSRMATGHTQKTTAPPETSAEQPQQRQNDEEEAAASPRSTAEPAPASDSMAAPSVRASSQEAAAPAPTSSDPEARPQPERVGSLVLRPLAQRLGGGAASAQPPADAAGGGLPMSPSGSLAEPGTGQPIGWAPRKSAWLPYRPSAGSLPAPQPQHGGDPPANCAPESPADAGHGATAASSSSSPGLQQQPAKLQPPVSLPVQNSLDILHEAAVSAAEGFLRLDSEPQAIPSLPKPEGGPQEREARPSTDADEEPGHQFFTGPSSSPAGQHSKDTMEALQAAASAIFRRFNEVQQSQVAERGGQLSDAAPIGFGSRLPSMAGSAADAARSATAAAAGGQPVGFTWQAPFPTAQSASAPEPASQNSGGEAASRQQSAERRSKGWEAAASLLGPVGGPKMPLTSAFSEALASRGGQLQSMAVPELQQAQPIAPRQHSGGHQDWATAKLGSAGSDGSFALPLTAWRLGSGPEGMKLTGSLPMNTCPEGGVGFFKAPGPLSVRAGTHNAPSLTMPGTPSITNMPSRSSLSPPLSPQHGLQEGFSTLGRQLEMCLARQVQLHNVKRNAPATAFLTEDPASGAPVLNPRLTGFGPVPWPHAAQHSLDSQVSRTQLAQLAVDRADFFKVPGNLANFLKQASLDTAMAALQQREAMPPTPHMRQLPSGAGAVWPFALGPTQVPSLRPGGMPQGGLPPSAQLDGSPQRLGTLNIQSPLLRQQLGSLGADHSMQRFQASQQMFSDYCGGAATTPEAALADSLYASVARQLQSGAGPAQFPQAQHQSLQAAAEEAAAAGGGFYRLDSGASLGAHGMAGGNPYGDVQQQVNMLELLGLLRAGLVGKGAAAEAQTAAPKRKRHSDRPASGRRDGGEADPGAPQPKRAASNNKCEECGTTETPTWRRWGPTLLCNACGLRRKKSPKSAVARATQPPAAAAATAAFQAAAWVAGPEPGSSVPNAASPQHQQ
ncbi:g7649 [Coccomyxa elongata]